MGDLPGYSEAEFEAMEAQAALRKSARASRGETEPAATAAHYDRTTRKFTLDLANGTGFIFPADQCQGLAGASDAELAAVELTPGGYGLHWESLDADLSVAGLLLGSFGGRTWMEALRREVNRAAGRGTSPAKTAAVRENGKKGGRPRKAAP